MVAQELQDGLCAQAHYIGLDGNQIRGTELDNIETRLSTM